MTECPKCLKTLSKTSVACRRCFKPVHLTCAGFRVFAEVYRQIWKNNNVHFFCVRCNIRRMQCLQPSNNSKPAVRSLSPGFGYNSSTTNPRPDLAEIFPVGNNSNGNAAATSSSFNKLHLAEVLASLNKSPEAVFQLIRTKIHSDNRHQISAPAPPACSAPATSERHNLQQSCTYLEHQMYAPSPLPLFDDGIEENMMPHRQSYQGPYYADNLNYCARAEPEVVTNNILPLHYNYYDLTVPPLYASNEANISVSAVNTGFNQTLPIPNDHQTISQQSFFAADIEKFPPGTPSHLVDEFLTSLANLGEPTTTITAATVRADRPLTPLPYPSLNDLPMNINYDQWATSTPYCAASDPANTKNYSSNEMNFYYSMSAFNPEQPRSQCLYAEPRENMVAEYPRAENFPTNFAPYGQNVEDWNNCDNVQQSNFHQIPFNGGHSDSENHYEQHLNYSGIAINEQLSNNYAETSCFNNTPRQSPFIFGDGERVSHYLSSDYMNVNYPEIVKPIPLPMEIDHITRSTVMPSNDRLAETPMFPYECLFDSQQLPLNEPMLENESNNSFETPPVISEKGTLTTSSMMHFQNLSIGGWSSLTASSCNSLPVPSEPISLKSEISYTLNEQPNPTTVSIPPQDVLMEIVIPSTNSGSIFPATATVWLPNAGLKNHMQSKSILNEPLALEEGKATISIKSSCVLCNNPIDVVTKEEHKVILYNLPTKSCSPVIDLEELKIKSDHDSSAEVEFKEPPLKLRRTNTPSIEYQSRPMGVERNLTKQMSIDVDAETSTGLSLNDNLQIIPLPKITIISAGKRMATRRQSKNINIKKRSTTTQAAGHSRPKHLRLKKLQRCINDFIERLRTSERLSTPLCTSLKSNVIWSPIRRQFGYCNRSTVWIPLTRLTALDYSLKIRKHCNTLQQRRIKLRNFRSVWIPIPQYIRRIVKSSSGILWVAVSKRMLVSASLINPLNVSPLCWTIRTVNAMGQNFAEQLRPILATKIKSEVQAGRLERSWISLLSPQTMIQIIMDYWQIYRSPITHPIFCRNANKMQIRF